MLYELENVRAAYDGCEVLHGLSAAIREGEILMIAGPNGSGKSTFLKLLARLLDPTQGTVRFEGKPLAEISRSELARRIAFLPQSFNGAGQWTVRELVACGRFPHRGRAGREQDCAAVENALAVTGLTELQDRETSQLSGGERQRARIAMTLAQETDVILLDEPVSFLDVRAQFEILDLLQSLRKARSLTVIAVMHDLNAAIRYADKLLLLRAGSIFSGGTPQEVLTKDNIREVFGIEARLVPDGRGGLFCLPDGVAGKRKNI